MGNQYIIDGNRVSYPAIAFKGDINVIIQDFNTISILI